MKNLLLSLVVAAALSSTAARGTTLTVTSTADDGTTAGTLRSVLASATDGDTIDFSVTGGRRGFYLRAALYAVFPEEFAALWFHTGNGFAVAVQNVKASLVKQRGAHVAGNVFVLRLRAADPREILRVHRAT